jgi:hypothetical protein
MERTAAASRTGSASLSLTGDDPVGPSQTVDVTPGKYAARYYFYTPAGTTTGSWTRAGIVILDAQGNALSWQYSDGVYVGENAGGWKQVQFVFDILPDYNGVAPSALRMTPTFWAIGDGVTVYMDDVELAKYE